MMIRYAKKKLHPPVASIRYPVGICRRRADEILIATSWQFQTAAAYQSEHCREHDERVDHCKPKVVKAQLAPLRRAALRLSAGLAGANLRAAARLKASRLLESDHRRVAPARGVGGLAVV